MFELPVHSHSGTDVAAFTVGIIAAMQFVAWQRDRERSMLWFAAAYAICAALAAFNDALPPGANTPNAFYMLATYVARVCTAVGLTYYLGIGDRRRGVVLAALCLPLTVVGGAELFGAEINRRLVVAPLLYTDVGFSIMCLRAARREPGAGHAVLAFGSMIGPVVLGLARLASGETPLLRYYYMWPAAIGFGIFLLVVSALRRSRDARVAQAHAQRMANFYAALSHTNQVIVRVSEPRALFDAIVRICVDTGLVQAACVFQAEEGPQLRRVASAGPAERFLAGISDPLDLTVAETNGSYTAQVMRDGVPLVSNDYLADPRSTPWRQHAAERGVRALAWLPLRRDGRVVGVLLLSADEVGFFDAPLMRLLDDLAADIAFALDNIDREAARVEALRQAETGYERFSRLFHAAPIASAIVSRNDRRVVDINEAGCRRCGKTRDEIVGRPVDVAMLDIEGVDRERFYERLRKHLRVRNLLIRARDDNGALRDELLNTEPIDYQGESCHLLMTLDITDFRAAAEARQALAGAEAASRAKTEFLSRMSHELRTPLNAVLGFSELLRREAGERFNDRDLMQLEHIQQAGWHLLTLVNDVLDISRIETGQFGIDTCSLEITPLLDEALQMSQPLAQQYAVSLHAVYRASPPLSVLADPTRLRQVMLNLLSNAIKYNRAGGSVGIDAVRHGNAVKIEVVDTGLGMTHEQLEHLYEPFNRLGRERGGVEGTGIGLALTRQLVRLMHGELEVESEVGRGSIARVTLALADAPVLVTLPAHVEAAIEPVPSANTEEPAGVVLYIEDNPVNALLVEQLLARWAGVRLVQAEDGASGIELACSLRPDLVLLDMQLPDIDGIEVLRRLRAERGLQDIPIVVVSASAMTDEVQRARASGATDYWTKPLDFDRFLADVARLLDTDPVAP